MRLLSHLHNFAPVQRRLSSAPFDHTKNAKEFTMSSLVFATLRRRNGGRLLSSSLLQAFETTFPSLRTFSTVGNTFFDVEDSKSFVDSLFNGTDDGDLGIQYARKRLASVLDKPVQAGASAEELSPSERQVRLFSVVDSQIQIHEQNFYLVSGNVGVISIAQLFYENISRSHDQSKGGKN